MVARLIDIDELADYLVGSLRLREVNQKEANDLARADVGQRLKMTLVTEAEGSITEARKMQARLIASDYLEESGGKYIINRKKLKTELMEKNIGIGASLYSALS